MSEPTQNQGSRGVKLGCSAGYPCAASLAVPGEGTAGLEPGDAERVKTHVEEQLGRIRRGDSLLANQLPTEGSTSWRYCSVPQKWAFESNAGPTKNGGQPPRRGV